MEHAGNYFKQVLPRKKYVMNQQQQVWFIVLNKAVSMCVKIYGYAHLNVTLTELYDREGSPHHLPVTFIVDRANFGTITLQETEYKMSELRSFCSTRYKKCFFR